MCGLAMKDCAGNPIVFGLKLTAQFFKPSAGQETCLDAVWLCFQLDFKMLSASSLLISFPEVPYPLKYYIYIYSEVKIRST